MGKPCQMTIEIYLKLRDSSRPFESIQKEYSLSEDTVWSFEVGYQCYYLEKNPNSQLIIVTSSGSARAITAGQGGAFFDLGQEGEESISFQPLARIHEDNEIVWALNWILQLLENEQIPITPYVTNNIWYALESLKASPSELRTMTGLTSYIMDVELQAALRNYTKEGPYGKLFDASHDEFTYNSFQVYGMATLMETKKSIVEPTLFYIFHRIDQYLIHGKRTILLLDEVRKYIKNEVFLNMIEKLWFRELRKKGVDVIIIHQTS